MDTGSPSDDTNPPAADEDKQVEEALGILKDDKEFEEFECEDWSPIDEDSSDRQVWDTQWDANTEEVDDDFTKLLRSELAKLGYEAPSS